MAEVPEWPPQHMRDHMLSVDTQQTHDQAQPGSIVVRNTFIDVRRPEESDDEDSPCMSPHRRNLSAPPSPARRGRGGDGPDGPWNQESEDEEADLTDLPHYHWRPDQNLLAQAPSGGEQSYSDYPDQYIEDDPPAFLAPGSGPLLTPGEGDGKPSRKGRRQAERPAGQKGTQHPPLGSYLRSTGGALETFGPPPGAEGLMSGFDFSYANGFGGGFEQELSSQRVPATQQTRGREGHPGTHGGLQIGTGGLGGLGGFGQDLWASGKGWEGAEHQDMCRSGPAAGYAVPPPPVEPPPPRAANAGTQETHHRTGPLLSPPPTGQAANRKQRRSHGEQWMSPAEASVMPYPFAEGNVRQPGAGPPPGNFTDAGARRSSHGHQQDLSAVLMPPPGNFTEGGQRRLSGSAAHHPGGFMQPPGPFGSGNAGGLGIAAGAAAVGPVVGAGRERGPLLGVGSIPGNARGKDPLAVGSAAAVGSGAAVPPSPYGVGFPGGGEDMLSPLGAMPGGAPFHGAGPAFSSPHHGDMGFSQGRMMNAGSDGHGPWVPDGIDMSAAFAAASGSGRRGGDGGRGKGGAAAGGGNRMPLSGGGPKRTDYVRKYGPAVDDDGNAAVPITTMMLKNIPCRKSQEEVMAHIDKKGFGGKYDFFYLPRDVKFRANLGYAFINFITPEDAAQFQAELNGYRFANSGSSKACAVVPGHVQGLMNNLAAFKRTEVMRSSRKPYFSGVVAL